MIILDTNVLSELMRANPDENVLAWLDAQNSQDLQTTAITVAELLYGVARLPHGQRKTALRGAIESMLDGELAGKVLAFDNNSARRYAALVAAREAQGRPDSGEDLEHGGRDRVRQGPIRFRIGHVRIGHARPAAQRLSR